MYKFILFDLDGTLTDPKPGIVECVRYALDKEGLETFPNADLSWVIGPPLKESFSTLASTADETILKRLLSAYRERFARLGLYENRVYDGISDLLEQLVQLERRLYLATSKPTIYAQRILDHFQLAQFFTGVVGSELDETRSSKGAVIRYLLSTYNLSSTQCVMVGDRMHDVVGARENDMDSIGVLYGYGSQAELSQANPTYLVDNIPHLLSLLKKI